MDGVRKRALDIGRNRLLVTGAVILLAFGSVGARLVDLMITDGSTLVRTEIVKPGSRPVVSRADIVDRNGFVVATSLPISSLYADPSKILDASEAADRLISVLPELDRRVLLEKLQLERQFVWLKRGLTPEEKYEVNRLGIPGLAFRREESRVYPHGPLLAHVVGYTDTDDKGIAGVERQFNDALAGSAEPLQLSIDIRVQSLMRDELVRAVEEFGAIGAAGVVADIETGEILAMVSLPDFDPNIAGSAGDESAFNRVTKGVYEMGSTFKLLTAAMALDAGVVDITGGYDASKPIRVARFTITDYHPENRWLTVPEIIIHSSNIGSAKMALDVGIEGQQDYLRRFGMLSPADVELPEVGAPLYPRRWREINTMTISFGHGIAVSPLQLVGGIAALANGGVLRKPTLLARRTSDAQLLGERVLKPRTSEIMRGLMRLVVTRGTGRKANADGYMVGGKTGTADKLGAAGYRDDKRIASFVGAFPIQAPQYVVFAMVDEPKGIKRTFNYATGGWVAAPVVGNVVAAMGPLLGIQPTQDQEDERPLVAEAARFVKTWGRDGEAQ
ncbi:MAG: penicillin-binding protein 2 [Rhodospirillales bacterium]